VLATQMVVFHRPKRGSTAVEWEDGAGFDPGDPEVGRKPRCAVFDGATEAYDSVRWVAQLVESFLGLDHRPAPQLDPAAMDSWFAYVQQRWVDRAPQTFASVFEERKFQQEGSFATMLGCELDLGERPCWRAVALGDAVLFHVRDGQLVEEFPSIGAGGFGIDPDGVYTQPSQLPRMRTGLRFGAGVIEPGDQLLLCTDALAAWAMRSATATRRPPWATLAAIEHPAAFAALVSEQLSTRAMKNDDVTLLRVGVAAGPANLLVLGAP
jgi:hypothetical protein